MGDLVVGSFVGALEGRVDGPAVVGGDVGIGDVGAFVGLGVTGASVGGGVGCLLGELVPPFLSHGSALSHCKKEDEYQE